jgi:hypothetical protein
MPTMMHTSETPDTVGTNSHYVHYPFEDNSRGTHTNEPPFPELAESDNEDDNQPKPIGSQCTTTALHNNNNNNNDNGDSEIGSEEIKFNSPTTCNIIELYLKLDTAFVQ